MTVLNFALLNMVYFFGSSTALSWGVGYYTVYRPLISGMLSGLILGDVVTGMLAGTIVNIIYIDFVSTGGSQNGDQCLTGIMAAVCSVMLKMSPVEAAAIAYPFGFLGVLVWKYRLNINIKFVRLFQKRVESGKKPSIFVYNVVLPQLLLYCMCTVIMGFAIGIMIFVKPYILQQGEFIKTTCFFAGIFLVSLSVVEVLFRIKSKATISIFVVTLVATYFLNIDVILVSSVFLIGLCVFLYRESLQNKTLIQAPDEKYGAVLNKKDLIRSWFVWMNFSHACYNYERMQGMAFAHSMSNIIKKLYVDEDKRVEVIYSYTDFFNTEPNMATPIHGSIIAIEEEKSLGRTDVDINYIKKGMMGVAAGLGDSVTQVIIAPLFISLSLVLSLDRKFVLAVIPLILLAVTILYISYTGWMNGYYTGRESLIRRVKKIKNSKIRLYFSMIFPCILGMTSVGVIALNHEILFARLIGVCIVAIYPIVCKTLITNKLKDKYVFIIGYIISVLIAVIL